MRPIDYLTCLKSGHDPVTLAQDALVRSLENGDFSKSMVNCHLQGVDSIVLYDGEDGMIRFFVAHAHCHQLDRLYDEDGNFVIGIHNHKYEIGKIPLDAPYINVTTKIDDSEQDEFWLWEYGFESALQGGGMELVERGIKGMQSLECRLVSPGGCSVMKPSDLHTMVVDGTRTTSWMVIEGPKVDIEPLLYSPTSNLKLSSEGLYEPMSPTRARREVIDVLMRMAGLR